MHDQNCTYRESSFLRIKLTKDSEIQILVIDYCVSSRLYIHVHACIDINCHTTVLFTENYLSHFHSSKIIV